jgi:FMN phosphatase YigB (HAD superfamily)
LTSLQIPPEETLFVGDTPGDDIIGAKGVGMDVVWLNRRGQPLPVDIPQPEYEISRLEDLPGLLRGDT